MLSQLVGEKGYVAGIDMTESQVHRTLQCGFSAKWGKSSADTA